ncbi:MAG: glucose-6-phosphate isomerase [Thiolinea sp.]
MSKVEAQWHLLEQHGSRLQELHLRDLFTRDEERFGRLSRHLDDLLLDFSREQLDQAALDELLKLARLSGLEERREALFAGEKINLTEDRAVLHMALRDGVDKTLEVDGEVVLPQVQAMRERFLGFAEQVRSGNHKSVTNEVFTDVVNIGIGGSDLGPVMVTQALAPWHDGPTIHFVSNIDGADIIQTLKHLNPATTLVIVASKTFTTAETIQNFITARAWLQQTLGEHVEQHLVAVSSNLEETRAYGIADERVFGFWDWVGGRYSVWSAIGLPIALAVGRKAFEQFLQGARMVDQHFCIAPLAQNLPVLMALVGVWRRNIMQCKTVGLIPYDQHLARFPAYVQQLDMESNGKQIMRDGTPIKRASGPVIWGEAGTNAQHSFFQLLHQGSDITPIDFLVAANPSVGCNYADPKVHHDALLCNALAQAQALAFGRDEQRVREDMQQAGCSQKQIDQLASHRTFPGNRPSTLLIYQQLTPEALGKLVALYEHKVFVQGVIWNVNSYDQWGVELGKKLAKALSSVISENGSTENLDAATIGAVKHIHTLRVA